MDREAATDEEFAAHHARLVAHVVAGEIAVDVERVPLEQLPEAWRRKADGASGKARETRRRSVAIAFRL